MEVLILLGADRGDRAATFARAVTLLEERVGRVLARSRPHWTEPWGFRDEELFLNMAVLVESDRPPTAIMRELLRIEEALGRTRDPGPRYAPRTIDLDILLIGDRVIGEPGLTVPHPRLHERAFALGPAADLVPEWIHPTAGRTVLALLDTVPHSA